MLLKENVTSYLIAINQYMLKKGKGDCVKPLLDSIKIMTGEAPIAIYVNEVDNYHLPDVAVVHVYSPGYSKILMDPDSIQIAPNGYTIEIAERCFTKYSEEELGAVILHDMLHNVFSDTAKIRFIHALNATIDKKGSRFLLDLIKNVNWDITFYLAMAQICINPFQAPINNYNYVGTDDVLKAVGLADAYESYLNKIMELTKDKADALMDRKVKDDYDTMTLLMQVCIEGQEDGYAKYVHDAFPLISLEMALNYFQQGHLLGSYGKTGTLGTRLGGVPSAPMDESYNNPTSDYDIQYAVDKIVNAMRYAETEAERDVVLYRIRTLSLKIIKIREKLEKTRTPSNTIAQRLVFLQERQQELEELRKKCLAMEIKEKRWSVYVKDQMPEGYDM